MKRRNNLAYLLVPVLVILIACGLGINPEPTSPPPPTEAPTAQPTSAVTPEVETGAANTVEAEADRDTVFTVRQGSRQALPAAQQSFLEVGDGVDVDETGRAILRFGDLLTVELLRDGNLVLQELAADEGSAFVSVLQNGGILLNDFNPQQEINRRLTVQTEFAVITATGTRFIVTREPNSPLEWVVSLDAAAEDLSVSAEGVTKQVATGVARWIAPIDEPSAGISANMANVQTWLDGVQRGVPQPPLGEVVWGPADMLVDTAALAEPPLPGQPFDLGSSDQGVVRLTLDPAGAGYDLRDCNGDGIRDLVLQAGTLHMDFRPVLARVRALDVTVINLDQPGGGILRVLDPGRGEIASQRLAAGYGQGQVLSMRSDQPYHYAVLEMQAGCFLGLSLTPPSPDGTPGAPRPAVENWRAAVITGGTEGPPQNEQIMALPVGAGDAYPVALKIDGVLDDWETLAQLTGVDWTSFSSVVYDAACANRSSAVPISRAADLAGRVLFAWDENYLYVAFAVIDDSYVGYSGADQRYYLGDAPQLLLDVDLAGDLNQTTLSPDDWQIDLYADLNEAQGPIAGRAALWQLDILRARDFREARVTATPADVGYFLEAALPWKSLGFTPQPGANLGLAASVSDNDTPGTNTQECMISTAPQRDWQNPTTWRPVLLLSATQGG
jgi:hypothetical protein